MSEVSGDEKEKEVTPESEAEKAKKQAELQDTLSRFLSRKSGAATKPGGNSAG